MIDRADVTLIVSTSWPSEGDPIAGTFVAADVAARVRDGRRVVVLAPEGRGLLHAPAGATVIGLPHRGTFGTPGALATLRRRPSAWLGALEWARAARAAVSSIKHDTLVLHWLIPTGLLAHCSPARTIELWAHGGDVRLLEAMPRPLARRLLAALVARPSARVIAVSSGISSRIRAIEPALSPTVMATRLALEDPALEARVHARGRELRLRSRRPLAVVAARLIDEKRIDRALHWARINDCSLALVGDGPARQRLVAQARALGVDCTATGALAHHEALAWLAAADVVLAPLAAGEGAPTVVREAAALDRAIVVFDEHGERVLGRSVRDPANAGA